MVTIKWCSLEMGCNRKGKDPDTATWPSTLAEYLDSLMEYCVRDMTRTVLQLSCSCLSVCLIHYSALEMIFPETFHLYPYV
jgi:hypothetical protein